MPDQNCNETIRLGLMPPLTGLVGMYGPEIIRAAQIACNEINDSGGLLGKKLELIIEDDGSLPGTAVPAALRLVKNHHCVAIIGNLLSNSRIAVAYQVAEPLRVPYLNFSFYEGSIFSRYFFHFAALPNQQIDKMIPAMAQYYGLKMYFAGSNYEWPRGSIDAAKEALSRLDGDVVGEDYLPINADAAEIEQLLQKVARSGADVFVPYFAGTDQIALLNRFCEMGLKQRIAVVMGHYDETLAQQLLPEVREGFYSSSTYFMSLDTPQNHQYLEQLAKLPGVNGVWPSGNGVVTNFSEATYVCVKAFAEAVKQAGSVDSEALLEALERTSVLAPQGWVQMDAKTHHACVNSFLARSNKDGSFSIIERFGNIPPIMPLRYQNKTAVKGEHPLSPSLIEQINAEAESSLRKLNTAHQILSIADMAVLATDENGVIQEANPNTCTLFGYSAEEIRGMSIHLLLPPHLRRRHAAMMDSFVQGRETQRQMSQRSEITGYRKDGSFFPLEASIGKFHNGRHWMLVATMRDISELKRKQVDLLWQATHDELTGLPNRSLIQERLSHALQRSRRQGLSLALLFVDLDGFKLVNDTYGHEIGDLFLKTIGNQLIGMVRPGDTVARLSGDEFGILCEQLEQPTSISTLAERINQSLRQPIEINGHLLYITVSIGIAVGHGSTHSADDLLRAADTAMHEVKQLGRDGWHFFSASLEEKVRKKLTISNGLRVAIERDELSVCLQPIVDANSTRISGAEMLLRWNSPDGPVSPALFIPIAEMTGSIVKIGGWVFAQACRIEADWRQRWGDQAPAYISVNVSARQLSEKNLLNEVGRSIKKYASDPKRILLEITETALMADIDTNLRALRALAALGFQVAIDDFGTGYSSLAQITRLPVNVLKIDKAFVDGIENQIESRSVVKAVIGLGRSLGLRLVAEGVENSAQLLELRNFGCDSIQGYLFHRPMPEEQFVETFQQDSKKSMQSDQPPLFFLLYSSRATDKLQQAEIPALLEKTRLSNLGVGVTGCLLHQDGYFMQLLEGDEAEVLNLLTRIQKDERHCDVKVILQGREYHRVFPEWSMGFRDIGQYFEHIDFSSPTQHRFSLMELSQDPQTCYVYMTSFRG